MFEEPFQTEIFFSNDNNCFDVWPGFLYGLKPKLNTPGLRLYLEKWDMIVFHSTLQHRGASFPSFNVRVHNFWHSHKIVPTKNSTSWVCETANFDCGFFGVC